MTVATNCFFLIISFAGHHINILILFFGKTQKPDGSCFKCELFNTPVVFF